MTKINVELYLKKKVLEFLFLVLNHAFSHSHW